MRKSLLLATLLVVGIQIDARFAQSKNQGIDSAAFLKVLSDLPPHNLIPIDALDRTSQQINNLLYRGLVALNPNLHPVLDMAKDFSISPNKKTYTFNLQPNLKDHSSRPIDSKKISECISNYFDKSNPARILSGNLSFLEAFAPDPTTVRIVLKSPDPSFLKTLAHVKYFRTNSLDAACIRPVAGGMITGSGEYELVNPEDVWNPRIQNLTLIHRKSKKKVQFLFTPDESTRAMILLKGEVDVAINGMFPSKIKWMKNNLSQKYFYRESAGANVTYLGFNHSDPDLSKQTIRRAIAQAIDREAISRYFLKNLAVPAGGILVGAPNNQISFELDRSKEILQPLRLKLSYKTTTSPFGIQRGLLIRDMLQRVGVSLRLDVVDPAVFFQSISVGNFQLFSSRWIGAADESVYKSSLETGAIKNRFHYSNPIMDTLLSKFDSITSLIPRMKTRAKVEELIWSDLPYMPLWTWKNTIFISKRLTVPPSFQVPKDGGFGTLYMLLPGHEGDFE